MMKPDDKAEALAAIEMLLDGRFTTEQILNVWNTSESDIMFLMPADAVKFLQHAREVGRKPARRQRLLEEGGHSGSSKRSHHKTR